MATCGVDRNIITHSTCTCLSLVCKLRHLMPFCSWIHYLYSADMDSTTSQRLIPLGHSKIIHLVRHAQANHNVAGKKDHDALLSPEFFDASLSSLGLEQVSNLSNHVYASGLLKKIDLVITSPLLRAMQTAVGVFGRERSSGLKCPPIIAVELCRERTGVHPCDKRKTIREYSSLFPQIDFSLIESDDDNLWKADVRETEEEVAARGLKFMNWLKTRHETEIAVVTHHRFLQYTLSAIRNDFHPSLRSEICKEFSNCELRSMIMVDKRMVNSPTTDSNGERA
ncbi:phosphoglycerate mutase-like protein 1 isoform X2 [Manihot esculenta]|uniref:phosphoglycerate mutase-like protein 1 isoform X2 n=1 Tax=Manihot esculenta TaxID=3983 RepID=UPI000B5D5239|nr:phosphoglycerate mutase-like protein 1 isoform X2 [Manihot esculenta]